MLWPLTTMRDPAGRLSIDGIALADLADEFGTPLYVYHEGTIRHQCAVYRTAFAQAYPGARIAYAGKAYLSSELLSIIDDEGMGLDVVSAGELMMAYRSGFPLDRVVFHGNNKTLEELRLALELGIGEIIVDNLYELDLLETLTSELGKSVDILLRINPNVDVHTHDYRKTAIVDSKFGLLIEPGFARQAVERVLEIPRLRLRGYHAHIGSQIFEIEPFLTSIDTLFAFAADMHERYDVIPAQISPGGGFGIQYQKSDPNVELDTFAERVSAAMRQGAERYDLPLPALTIEPGRTIVGQAGVALYRVGAIKEIPGVRRYVSVDGGMADNIRPALYGAQYEAEIANRDSTERALVTIAGKYCESGDVLVRDVELAPPEPGDIVALPAAGAYCLAMASNYNLALKPAVVMISDGTPRLIQRRETYDDLLGREVRSVAHSTR
ncbi:MAG TPA: diaminopimelate decarboxylase [Nitrolancea sp.]|nr:diaminopimelate decarboxylase [Nitrolancea sp.]